MPARKLPRPFTMHWGSGQIVEEATHVGQWHESTIQLMEYTEGEGAGGYSVRFCVYTIDGRFNRMPLMVGEEDIEGLRKVLRETPRLRALLKKLVE